MKDAINTLYSSIQLTSNKSLYYVVQICLTTGARWSESQTLTLKDIKNGGFYFLDTKNGKNRYIPVSPAIEQQIKQYLQINKSFDSCYSAFRSALNRSGIETPDGQCSHILRHTYASHFLMNGSDILTLQKILIIPHLGE